MFMLKAKLDLIIQMTWCKKYIKVELNNAGTLSLFYTEQKSGARFILGIIDLVELYHG